MSVLICGYIILYFLFPFALEIKRNYLKHNGLIKKQLEEWLLLFSNLSKT